MFEKFCDSAIIVCAVCKYQDIILCGPRHWDKTMGKQFDLLGGKGLAPSSYWEQGFIDQFGNYYNRTEALLQVLKSKQLFNRERNSSDIELYSEGLY